MELEKKINKLKFKLKIYLTVMYNKKTNFFDYLKKLLNKYEEKEHDHIESIINAEFNLNLKISEAKKNQVVDAKIDEFLNNISINLNNENIVDDLLYFIDYVDEDYMKIYKEYSTKNNSN